MTSNAILLDLDRCVGCEACLVACKAGSELADGQSYSQVREVVYGRLPDIRGAFVHQRCFHCAEAACVAVCPTGALAKQDGFTAVDPELCSGCGYCVEACPFDVPRLVNGRVSKCTGCLDLARDGKLPWCVQTCPSRALEIGPRDELVAEAKRRVAALKDRHPDAQVYGEDQLGGLGLLLVLTEKPDVLGLLENPTVPPAIKFWQDVVQPASAGLTGIALAASGLAFIIARRAHLKELRDQAARAELAARQPASADPQPIAQHDGAAGTTDLPDETDSAASVQGDPAADKAASTTDQLDATDSATSVQGDPAADKKGAA